MGTIIHETQIKEDFMKKLKAMYPLAHSRIIPSSKYSLLPYDAYALWRAIFRAIEFKVDDHPVEAHQIQALYEVTAQGGYSFVVRWINLSHKFIVESYSTGESRVFTPTPSGRQLSGKTPLDIDEPSPKSRSETIVFVVQYVMSFEVSPLESEIQRILSQDYVKKLQQKLGG